MIEIVSFVREHRNGFCGREVVPAEQCNPEEFKFFCDLAKSGNHAPLDNGEVIWDVRIYSVRPDEVF